MKWFVPAGQSLADDPAECGSCAGQLLPLEGEPDSPPAYGPESPG